MEEWSFAKEIGKIYRSDPAYDKTVDGDSGARSTATARGMDSRRSARSTRLTLARVIRVRVRQERVA